LNSIENFVEATLNLTSAEIELKKELMNILHIPEHKIKSITLKNIAYDTKVLQTVVVELSGKNKLKGKDIQKIDGLSIVTPNTLEIDAGELNL
jgi:hypothetical protein